MEKMMDAFNLINMNGRAYDPLVAQFLSLDPYVQYPENPQSYNRYAYCLNNPMKYTDPSGYFSYEEFANQSLGWGQLAWKSWINGGCVGGYNRMAEQYLTNASVMKDIEYKQWVGSWIGEGAFGKGGALSDKNTPYYRVMRESNDQKPETFCGKPFDEAGHFFKCEADAYLYMWKRDIVFKKENMCFVTDYGVLVLPCVNSTREQANNHNIDGTINKNRPFYYNTCRVGKKLFVVPPRNIFNGTLQVKAIVHTHGLDGGFFSGCDGDAGAACGFFQNIPFYRIGGFSNIRDPRSFQGCIGLGPSCLGGDFWIFDNLSSFSAIDLFTGNLKLLSYYENNFLQ